MKFIIVLCLMVSCLNVFSQSDLLEPNENILGLSQKEKDYYDLLYENLISKDISEQSVLKIVIMPEGLPETIITMGNPKDSNYDVTLITCNESMKSIIDDKKLKLQTIKKQLDTTTANLVFKVFYQATKEMKWVPNENSNIFGAKYIFLVFENNKCIQSAQLASSQKSEKKGELQVISNALAKFLFAVNRQKENELKKDIFNSSILFMTN